MTNPEKPSSIHSKKIGRFTRRRLMKALSTTGLASASIGALSVDDVRGAASDEVPIALDTEGNSTEYVDADWYDRLVRARKVRNAVDENWLSETASEGTREVRQAVIGVWLDAGSGTSEPHVIVSLDRDAAGLAEARGAIPERRNGVPIRLEETDREEELACSPQSKSDTSSMPGGLAVNFSGSDGSTQGTLTSRVIDDWGFHGDALMTAAHVPEQAEGECGSSLLGMTARHNGDKIGEVNYVDHEHDIAVIYESGGTTPLNEVWNPEDHSERYTITGTMTMDAIDTWIDNDRLVWKYGVGECYSQGTIAARGKKEAAVYNEDCTSDWYDTVRWGSYDSIGPGDSGSITFGKNHDGGGFLASNINSWRWWDYSAGPAGYAIRSDHGYYWG